MRKFFVKYIEFVAGKHLYVHIFLVVVVLTLGIGIYFQQGISTQSALAEQMLHRQQVVVRAGAISIRQFLDDFGTNLSLVAKDGHIVNPDNITTDKDLKAFVDGWSRSDIEVLSLYNSKGIVTHNYNTQGTKDYIGIDASDRGYFKWAKTAKEGDYYVGSPVRGLTGVLKGVYIIPIAAPVFDINGKFDGLLATGIRIDKLVKKFSDPLVVSDTSMVFMVDAGGNFVFSPVPSLVGTSVSSLLESLSFRNKNLVINRLNQEFTSTKTEGKFSVVFPDLLHNNNLTDFLVVYSTFNVYKGNNWTLLITTPSSDAYLFTGPFYRDQIVSLVFLILVVLAFSIVGLTSYRVMQKRVER